MLIVCIMLDYSSEEYNLHMCDHRVKNEQKMSSEVNSSSYPNTFLFSGFLNKGHDQ